MISRVAEHCYWMARYLERAESTARLLEVNYTLLMDFSVPTKEQWRPMLIIAGLEDFDPEATGEEVQEYMTWDEANGSSIARCLASARENARIIREVISGEVWEQVNYHHLWMRSSASRELYYDARVEFYNQIRRVNQLIHGVADATMLHGEAWEFVRLGRYLERALQTARILDVKYHMLLPQVEDVGTPVDHAHWFAILKSCSGYEPFHKTPRNAGIDTGLAVAEFLLFDPAFPRSVVHCVARCLEALRAIGHPPTATAAEDCLRGFAERLARRPFRAMVAEGLHESLTEVVDTLQDCGLTVDRSYFDLNGQELAFAPPARSQSQSQGSGALA